MIDTNQAEQPLATDGGQRIEVVPDWHLVIAISTDVDFTSSRTPVASQDDTQRLVDVIAPHSHIESVQCLQSRVWSEPRTSSGPPVA